MAFDLLWGNDDWARLADSCLTIRRTGDYAMARFRVKDPAWPGGVESHFMRYCDKAFLSPREGRQLAERIAQSGPTFSLESSGGLIEGMFCGPTYLMV